MTKIYEYQSAHRKEPTRAEVESGLQTGLCPWCGDGPFKLLAGHTSKTHGVGRVALRSAAGRPTHRPTVTATAQVPRHWLREVDELAAPAGVNRSTVIWNLLEMAWNDPAIKASALEQAKKLKGERWSQ